MIPPRVPTLYASHIPAYLARELARLVRTKRARAVQLLICQDGSFDEAGVDRLVDAVGPSRIIMDFTETMYEALPEPAPALAPAPAPPPAPPLPSWLNSNSLTVAAWVLLVVSVLKNAARRFF